MEPKNSNTMHRYQNTIMLFLYAGVLIAGYGVYKILTSEIINADGLAQLRLYLLAGLICFFIAIILVHMFLLFLRKLEYRPNDNIRDSEEEDDNSIDPLSLE